ncbi:hypothetical protein [Anaerovorax odorimutans]|uniref:hypothetical protein n=1 Tax=Anaerovorax odorimutans TaxID=109327 RepID=UPI00041C925F|nr:hypothetical protein [Anaerovorax odorimutans]
MNKKTIKRIKYLFFILLAIAVYTSEWYYTNLSNTITSKNQITTNDINTLNFWRNTFKCLLGIGIVTFLYEIHKINKSKDW